LLSKVLVYFQRLQKVRENLVVDPSLSLPIASQFGAFFSRVPPVISETNSGSGVRGDCEKKMVYKVGGDVFLSVSLIRNVTLVEFV